MRKRALLGSIGMAAVLCLALIHQPGSAQAAGSGGDFIVRCFFNGNVATMDPILQIPITTMACSMPMPMKNRPCTVCAISSPRPAPANTLESWKAHHRTSALPDGMDRMIPSLLFGAAAVVEEK